MGLSSFDIVFGSVQLDFGIVRETGIEEVPEDAVLRKEDV